MTLLDVHTHALPTMRRPSNFELAHGWLEISNRAGFRRVIRNGTAVRDLQPEAWDASARLEVMDRDGVDVQIVSPAPFAFLYDADPEVAAEFAAHLNEQIAAMCAADPRRLIGFGTVPLQDPESAIAELRHAVLDLGLAGLEIGSNPITARLHDHEMVPFFTVAEDLDVPLFLHPGPLGSLDRAGDNGLAFALARPVETEFAIGALVHGGILERHPRLRVCVSHGGAGVPAQAGRWQEGWRRRTPGVREASVSPRVLLRRLWADTLTYDPSTMSLLARTFGSDHLVLGTDFPFAAQESPPGAAFAEAVATGQFDPESDWQQALCANTHYFLHGDDAVDVHPGTTDTDSPTRAESR
jgi:aminocarboxymuconate-semialdehyde decarboxylase